MLARKAIYYLSHTCIFFTLCPCSLLSLAKAKLPLEQDRARLGLNHDLASCMLFNYPDL
jgi:hypothetical protein